MFLTCCSPRSSKRDRAGRGPSDGRRPRCRPRQAAPALEPRRDVDAIAVDVVAVDDHVAEVDADPELDAVRRLEVRVVLGDAPLHLDRALDSVDHARELDQRAVAGELDDAAAMLGDPGLDEVLAQRLEPGVRAASSSPISRL